MSPAIMNVRKEGPRKRSMGPEGASSLIDDLGVGSRMARISGTVLSWVREVKARSVLRPRSW